MMIGFDAWSRMIQLVSGQWTARGELVVFLQGAAVRDAEGTWSVPAAAEAQRTDLGAGALVAERFHHAFLLLHHGSATGEAASIVCRNLTVDVAGNVTAFGSEGRNPGAAVTLTGHFVLDERTRTPDAGIATAPVDSRAAGRIDAISLDFQPIVGTARDWRPTAAGVTLLAVTALVTAMFFYTRLKENALVHLDRRGRLLDTVVANPGIRFADLVARTGTSGTNARYHLNLLRQARLVRSLKVSGSLYYVPWAENPTAIRRRLLVSSDRRVQHLVRHMNNVRERQATEVAVALQRECGLSRAGSWKVIERATEARLIEREVIGRKVMVRAAPV